MGTRMQQRRATAAEWTAANPVLSDGEIGWVRNTGEFKIGDGVTPWEDIDTTYIPITTSDLLYLKNQLIDAAGDLIVGSADGVPTRLGVGSDGWVLTADSAQPLKLRWQQLPTTATNVVMWTPNVAYALNQPVINPTGELVYRTAATGSEPTYDASKWSTPASGLYIGITGGVFTGDLTVGNDDQDKMYRRAVLLETHQRTVTMGYTGSNLTSVTEKDGATTVKTTTLSYTAGKLTQSVEVVGSKTVTTTFTYDGSGNLTTVGRVVT